jgi:CxxC-x17-CxxC domain-containing protein
MKKQSQSEADIIGLITKVLEQLAALDKKVDALIVKPVPPPAAPRAASQPQAHPQPGARPNDHHQARQMYQATCADCKQACEIPFKPSGDRPVYCQECFRRRKAGNNVKTLADNPPKVTSTAETVITPTGTIQAPLVKDKKRLSAARKPSAKKRPVVKKKK